MRAHTQFRRGKVRALDCRTRRAEAAVIVLVGRDRAAVAEEARFLQRLRKRHIGPHTLACAFLIIIRNERFRRNGDVRMRVVHQQIIDALLFRRHRCAQDGVRCARRRHENARRFFHWLLFGRRRIQDVLDALGKRLLRVRCLNLRLLRPALVDALMHFHFRFHLRIMQASGVCRRWKRKSKCAEHERRQNCLTLKRPLETQCNSS